MVNKSILSLFPALFLCLSVLSIGSTVAAAVGGEVAYYLYAPAGTENNPIAYTISSAQQLKDLADSVNDTSRNLTYSHTTFGLTQNIRLSSICGASLNGGTSRTPIGNSSIKFSGHLTEITLRAVHQQNRQ